MEGLTHEGATPESETDKGSRSNLIRFIVVAVVVVLALGYMVYAAFPGNALYFLTVDEFVNKSEVHDGRLLRVSGKLVDGSFQREERSITSNFRLHDKELGPAGSQLDAQYVGVLPDLFFNPHSEIILEGSYSPEAVFHADSILVKCPSKYQSLEEELSKGDVTGSSS